MVTIVTVSSLSYSFNSAVFRCISPILELNFLFSVIKFSKTILMSSYSHVSRSTSSSSFIFLMFSGFIPVLQNCGNPPRRTCNLQNPKSNNLKDSVRYSCFYDFEEFTNNQHCDVTRVTHIKEFRVFNSHTRKIQIRSTF